MFVLVSNLESIESRFHVSLSAYWLKPDRSLSQVLHNLQPFPSEKMNAYPVGELVNSDGANEPSMIQPVGARLQSEVKPLMRVNTSSRYYHKKKDAPEGSWGELRAKNQ